MSSTKRLTYVPSSSPPSSVLVRGGYGARDIMIGGVSQIVWSAPEKSRRPTLTTRLFFSAPRGVNSELARLGVKSYVWGRKAKLEKIK